jgi:hypothetical protein
MKSTTAALCNASPPASAIWNMQSAFRAEVAQAIDSEHTQFPRLPNWKLLLKKSFC